MKFLKYLFFLILIVFIGVALYFGTQDGKFSVTETKEIQAPIEVVFEEVNDLKNWKNWGSWLQEESLKINYPDKTTGNGAFYSWSGVENGAGVIETIDLKINEQITHKIVFNGSLDDRGNEAQWTFESLNNGESTSVNWTMEGNLSLFDKIYFAIKNQSFEEEVRLLFAESLKNLETVIEKKLNEYAIEVKGLTNHSGGFYIYNTSSSKLSEIELKTTSMFQQITSFINENSLSVQGNPFVIYNEWDAQNKTAIFSVGVFTSDMVILPDGSPVLSGYMEASTTIKTRHTGKHSFIGQAWDETEKYIQKNGFLKSQINKPFEVYVLQAPQEKNPSKWVTDIYLPIEINQDGMIEIE